MSGSLAILVHEAAPAATIFPRPPRGETSHPNACQQRL